jgi:predicted RNA binding protein YcfA (HicA-like mRNA interferase family)
MKTKEIIKRLESEGWVLVRQNGSHKQFKKAGVKELITVSDHGSNKEPSIGVLNSIKKIAGWK